MKKLFVLGDSISIHYGPYLEQYLSGSFAYDRKGRHEVSDNLDVGSKTNGGDSRDCLAYLTLLPDLDYDILLLNCGLHDIKTVDLRQVEEEKYRENLEKMISLVHGRGKQVVWVTTTPVDDERHNRLSKNFSRYDRDRLRYNEIALEVMKKFSVPVIDLCGFTQNLQREEPVYLDHIHFTEPVRKLQAAYIAGSLFALYSRLDKLLI